MIPPPTITTRAWEGTLLEKSDMGVPPLRKQFLSK